MPYESFSEFWKKREQALKTHDIPIQHDLDEVKDEVHELDVRVDRYEDANGKLKPGVHVDKKTKHTSHFIEDGRGNVLEAYNDPSMDEVEEALAVRDGSAQHQKAMLNGEEAYTPQAEIEKPGADSIHTQKFDDCVRDVQQKNPKANAYAVCTAQLGEQSFKSEHRHKAFVKKQIWEAKKEMGISFAGPVPGSLLARQDLEGEAIDSEEDLMNGDSKVWKKNKKVKK
jgi:hypothetical protein